MNALVPVNAAPPMSIPDVERVALAIAKGGLFGCKDPNAVLTLCLLAQAEGQHPAVVFRDYHIINGKPAKKAEAMLRDFLSAGGRVEWHALTDELADATFSHHGGGTIRIDWTLQRARDAGIANPMWKKYPRQMLRSRVISEGVRSVCPSATSGLYEVGEVQDMRPSAEEVPEGGFVEGQFDARQVSPNGPADFTAVNEEMEAKRYAFPEGPAPNITTLKTMARQLWREIESCTNQAELDNVTTPEENAENAAIIKQLSQLENPAHREIWEGDGKDNPGIAGLIVRKESEIAQTMVDYIRAG